jgi:hypothetical protein
MILIEYGNGLLICEAIRLKWHDIDFAKCTAVVNKSVVKEHVGDN